MEINERFIWAMFDGKRFSLCEERINWSTLFAEHFNGATDPDRFNLDEIKLQSGSVEQNRIVDTIP